MGLIFILFFLTPVWTIFVAGLPGGGLFYVGWRYFVNDRHARFARCFWCYVLANFMFLVCGGFPGLLLLLRERAFVGVCAILAGQLAFWVVQRFLVPVPFPKALLVWLPSVPVQALCVWVVYVCVRSISEFTM